MPRNKYNAGWERIAKHPGIAVRALMVQHAINGFAESVAAKYPPGTEVKFLRLRANWREIDSPKDHYETLTGNVSCCQFPTAELASGGLMVNVSPEVLESFPKGLQFGSSVAVHWLNIQMVEGDECYIRRLEAELATYRNDSDLITRAWMAKEAEHSEALRREEEKGYARGVRDMTNQGYCSEPELHAAIVSG